MEADPEPGSEGGTNERPDDEGPYVEVLVSQEEVAPGLDSSGERQASSDSRVCGREVGRAEGDQDAPVERDALSGVGEEPGAGEASGSAPGPDVQNDNAEDEGTPDLGDECGDIVVALLVEVVVFLGLVHEESSIAAVVLVGESHLKKVVSNDSAKELGDPVPGEHHPPFVPAGSAPASGECDREGDGGVEVALGDLSSDDRCDDPRDWQELEHMCHQLHI